MRVVDTVTALSQDTITIRRARGIDAAALRRLAALDSGQVPHEPILLAEVDGVLRAALSLQDGSHIADPFAPSVHLTALLHERARSLRAGRGGAHRRLWRRSAAARLA